MNAFQKTAQQAVWLLAVVVVIVATILIFPRISSSLQGPSTAVSQSTQVDVTQTPAGYPGPEASAPPAAPADVTQTPAGYPGAEATQQALATESIMVDYEATQWAEATAATQVATATPIVLIGPRTLVDATGQYSLELPEGWWATALAGTYLRNYDDEKLADVHQFPPGGIKVDIGIENLNGRTLDEWLGAWIAGEASDEAVGPDTTFTEVQPYILGPHAASEYYVKTPAQFIREIAIAHDDRVIIIGISPADSSAMDEALNMLSNLKFLPR